VVICLELDAYLHMAQLMPLPLTVSCFSKIQIGFAFLVPADPGSPGKRAIKWMCVRVSTVLLIAVSKGIVCMQLWVSSILLPQLKYNRHQLHQA